MNAQWQTKISITLILLAITLCLPMSAIAKGSFPGTFANCYGYSIGCSYCHPNSDTSRFNFYGSDFRSASTSNGKDGIDNDCDGMADAEDSDCVRTKGGGKGKNR